MQNTILGEKWIDSGVMLADADVLKIQTNLFLLTLLKTICYVI